MGVGALPFRTNGQAIPNRRALGLDREESAHSRTVVRVIQTAVIVQRVRQQAREAPATRVRVTAALYSDQRAKEPASTKRDTKLSLARRGAQTTPNACTMRMTHGAIVAPATPGMAVLTVKIWTPVS
jgi:hypothetical protein